MTPTANTVNPCPHSDSNKPTSPSKGEHVTYNLRSGLKAILSTPALNHPIPDISLSDATLEGSGLFVDEGVTATSKKNSDSLPSKGEASKAVSRTVDKARGALERVASPVKNRSESVVDSARPSAASTADAAKSTSTLLLHSIEDKTSQTYAFAKRKAEESMDYAKHVAGDGLKYAKQKTGLAEDSHFASNAREGFEETKDGARKSIADANARASNVTREETETAKIAGSMSLENNPVINEHAGVLESLAGSAKNLAEKLGHAIHHPLAGTPQAVGATPVSVLPASPKKSAPSARTSSGAEIPSTSGQKVPKGAALRDEEIIFTP